MGIGMSNANNIICQPLNDSTKRFLLGRRGNTEMLAIGLNPSTANEDKLDPTSRNIQTISNNNSCDGWWLVNLYPKRTSKPSNLPKNINIALAKQNIDFIKEILSNDSYNIGKIVCCWGNHVSDYAYLQKQAQDIMNLVKRSGHNCLCIEMTAAGNPYHPSPMPVNRFLGGINNIKLKNYEQTTI
jgi:hypothetical protein